MHSLQLFFWCPLTSDGHPFVALCIHCPSTTGNLRVPRPVDPSNHGSKRRDFLQFSYLELIQARQVTTMCYTFVFDTPVIVGSSLLPTAPPGMNRPEWADVLPSAFLPACFLMAPPYSKTSRRVSPPNIYAPPTSLIYFGALAARNSRAPSPQEALGDMIFALRGPTTAQAMAQRHPSISVYNKPVTFPALFTGLAPTAIIAALVPSATARPVTSS